MNRVFRILAFLIFIQASLSAESIVADSNIDVFWNLGDVGIKDTVECQFVSSSPDNPIENGQLAVVASSGDRMATGSFDIYYAITSKNIINVILSADGPLTTGENGKSLGWVLEKNDGNMSEIILGKDGNYDKTVIYSHDPVANLRSTGSLQFNITTDSILDLDPQDEYSTVIYLTVSSLGEV